LDKGTLLQCIAEPGSGGTHGREAAKAQLEAVLAEDICGRLEQLSEEIRLAREVLGAQVSGLVTEIRETRDAMSRSAQEASALTGALLRWTRVSVLAIVLYTILTAMLVFFQACTEDYPDPAGPSAPDVSAQAAPCDPRRMSAAQ
jgi:hypothetical protein